MLTIEIMVYYLGIFISITIRTIRSKVQYTHLAAVSHNPDHAPLGYLSSVKKTWLYPCQNTDGFWTRWL